MRDFSNTTTFEHCFTDMVDVDVQAVGDAFFINLFNGRNVMQVDLAGVPFSTSGPTPIRCGLAGRDTAFDQSEGGLDITSFTSGVGHAIESVAAELAVVSLNLSDRCTQPHPRCGQR